MDENIIATPETKIQHTKVAPKLPIPLYDAKCPLCVRFKDSLLKFEATSHINPISIYEDEIYEFYKDLSTEICGQEVHYIKEDKEIIKGEAVVEHLIDQFPIVKKFSWLIKSGMGEQAVSYFHKMTNKYRKSLKRKCPSCTT